MCPAACDPAVGPGRIPEAAAKSPPDANRAHHQNTQKGARVWGHRSQACRGLRRSLRALGTRVLITVDCHVLGRAQEIRAGDRGLSSAATR